MKKKVLCLLLVVTLLMIVTACSDSENTDVKNGTKEQTAKDSVNIALNADITNLDPYATISQIDNLINVNLFDTLYKQDGTGEIVSSLAENSKMSDDGLSYTIDLKKGVKFHNGEEMKAYDVAFSLNTAKASPYLAGETEAIKEVSIIDDYSVRVDLNYFYSSLLSSLTSIYIVPEAVYTEADGAFGQKPVGTGAYQFISHETGQSVELLRFDEYFEGEAIIKSVHYKVITDPNVVLIALETGEIDLVVDLATSSTKEAKKNPDLAVKELESIGYNCLLMNNTVKPFDDVRVRQAFNYAINKGKVIEFAEEGMGAPSISPINKQFFDYSDNIKGYEYNVENAKKLLTDAGYPNGFEVSLKSLEPLKKSAQSIQEDLRQIGITANIELMEQNAYVQEIMIGNYQIGNMSFGPARPDVDLLGAFYSSHGELNIFKYANPRVDQLFTEGKAVVDIDARLEIYEELMKILIEDAVDVPLYHPVRTIVSDKNLNIGYANATWGVRLNTLSWN